jgi:methyl-accepting chemotaxis protein
MRNWFNNLRIGIKLSIGFGTCLLIVLAICLESLTGLHNIQDKVHLLTDSSVKSAEQLGIFGRNMAEARVYQYRFGVLSGDEALAAEKKLNSHFGLCDQALQDLAPLMLLPTGKQALADLSSKWNQYKAIWASHRDAAFNASGADGVKIVDGATAAYYDGELSSSFVRYQDIITKRATERSRDAYSSISTLIQVTVSLLFVSIILSTFAGTTITRKISIGVREIGERLSTLKDTCIRDLCRGLEANGRGDLSVAIECHTAQIERPERDEIGQLKQVYNETLAMIESAIAAYNAARLSSSDMIRQIGDGSLTLVKTSEALAASSEQTNASTTDIARGSEKLAAGATSSAHIMTELAASAEVLQQTSVDQEGKISTTTGHLAAAHTEIDAVVKAAQTMSEAARSGNDAVSETIELMNRVKGSVLESVTQVRQLDESGKSIGKFVQSIDEIAQQTNLLALNAAIEAARAGEHGRGFAVVADEVRKLAEGTSKATVEISLIVSGITGVVGETVKSIEQSAREAEIGANKSSIAGDALDRILHESSRVAEQSASVADLAKRITESIHEVATTTRSNAESASEMVRGADQVTESITNVAAISQESAASTEELAASVQEVSAVAIELSRMSATMQSLVSQYRLADEKASLRLAA